MSLVITSNRDNDRAKRQEDSVYSAWSYRNGLSSTYNIPANSQVCLQSAKVNLDGRTTLNQNNSWFYTWHGKALAPLGQGTEDGSVVDFNNCTTYPILQAVNQGAKNTILELQTEELADRINTTHREYHPNFMNISGTDNFDCNVLRNNALDFKGYSFKFNQNVDQNASTMPALTDWKPFYTTTSPTRFVASDQLGTKRITKNTGDYTDPCVAIGLGVPLSLSNGKGEVDTTNCDGGNGGLGVPWGFGISRDCPNPDLNAMNDYVPQYFDPFLDSDESELMNLGQIDKMYFEDIGIHRNASDELVIRQALSSDDGSALVYKELKYYDDSGSALKNPGVRYTLDKDGGSEKITAYRFTVSGEEVLIEGLTGAGYITIAQAYNATTSKINQTKPIAQTCWCLHPVLSIGGIQTNHLNLKGWSGIKDIKNSAGLPYDSRKINQGGWFETACLLGTGTSTGNSRRAVARCEEVDTRNIFNNNKPGDVYVPIGTDAGNYGINCSTAMILKTSNEIYPNTWGANMTEILGFPGRSIVITPADANFPVLTFQSDHTPTLDSSLSVFVRLNNFGQQVFNARSGNKSTILAHLPTADSKISESRQGQRMFYEPQNYVWLDIGNPYDMKVSEFNIDFVYINEQYAKILQGQSVVCLYFRTKPKELD